MISFDSLTLKIFSEENSEFFEGAKIQKIQQPSRTELLFQIRNKGETKKLYINFNPEFYHMCFITPETERLRNITVPKTALMFCMLLRKYILNVRILRVSVPEYERIFEIYFEYYNEFNEKSELCLAVELMGKYSNVILYNYDTNVIIGCAHNVSSEKSSYRELSGGLPYMYPLRRNKKDLLKTDFETFKNIVSAENIPQSVSSNFYYLTSVPVQDAAELIYPFNLKTLYDRLINILNIKDYSPRIKNDYSKYYTAQFPDTFQCSNINEMIDKYFSHHQNDTFIKKLRAKINKRADSELKRLYALKSAREAQSSKRLEAENLKKTADIITANIYNIKKGEKTAKLYDFEGKETIIALDENKSPAENAAKYYNLYKKAKSACEHALTMLEETKSEILYFEEIKYSAVNTDTIDDLSALASELFEEKTPEKDERVQNIPVIEFEGFKIYAGKNKKQNDYILSKLSSPNDLWFHPLNAAGAHVLIKTNKQDPPESIILKAAQLAKEYSGLKNNSKTSIIYTKRKYVNKAAKKQAFVTYKNETEVVI